VFSLTEIGKEVALSDYLFDLKKISRLWQIKEFGCQIALELFVCKLDTHHIGQSHFLFGSCVDALVVGQLE
jgi:hypothetical protein